MFFNNNRSPLKVRGGGPLPSLCEGGAFGGKYINLRFTIELLKDDSGVLHKIANALGVGRVLLYKDSAKLGLGKKLAQNARWS